MNSERIQDILATKWVNPLTRFRGVSERLVGLLVPQSCSWAAGLMSYGFCPAFALIPRIKNKGLAYGEAPYSLEVYRFLMYDGDEPPYSVHKNTAQQRTGTYDRSRHQSSTS